jgi:predicted GIY-YIG superfamily endonuclease
MPSSSNVVVYILGCSDATLYIGDTRNIDLRLIRHNEGSATPSTSIVHVRMPSVASTRARR